MSNAPKFGESFSRKTTPLQKLCLSITDCHHSTPKWTAGGKIVVRNFNIKKGKLDLSSPSFTNQETYLERTSRAKPEAGDLIITREAPMGEICVIPKGIDCCLGQRMVLIKPDKSKISSKYLLYAMLSEFVQGQINQSNKTGSIVSNLRIPLLKELAIPLIDNAEEVASTLFAIDSKIDCNNRINSELETLAKTLYDYWFVQFDFPNANGMPHKSSGGKMIYNTALKREIPAGWTNGTLDDLGQIVGGSTPSTQNPDNFTTNGTSWITPNDLSDNQGNKFITRGALDVSEEGIKDASLKKYPPGTVLLSSRAPIGYMAISRTEVTTNQGFKSFIPSNDFSSAFIYYTVKSSLNTITRYASGSTFKEVSATVLKTVKISLPTSDVVKQFTKQVSSILQRQDLLEQENQQLDQLRDWLLPMLMNGQVSVT